MIADHPEQQVPSAEVVRRGWIINAPRLRDRLERLLAGFVGVSSCSENGGFLDRSAGFRFFMAGHTQNR